MAKNLSAAEKTCGDHSKENSTYFVNEGFPKPYTVAPKVCTLTLDKVSPEVKQLRLEFLNFKVINFNRHTNNNSENYMKYLLALVKRSFEWYLPT